LLCIKIFTNHLILVFKRVIYHLKPHSYCNLCRQYLFEESKIQSHSNLCIILWIIYTPVGINIWAMRNLLSVEIITAVLNRMYHEIWLRLVILSNKDSNKLWTIYFRSVYAIFKTYIFILTHDYQFGFD